MQVLVLSASKVLGGCIKKGMAPFPQLIGREVSGHNVPGIGMWDWEKFSWCRCRGSLVDLVFLKEVIKSRNIDSLSRSLFSSVK